MSPLTEQDQANLVEMTRLLDEAYDHYFEYSDGHCKSSEGYVGLHFNSYFDRRDTDGPGPWLRNVEVYSYVFGPSRSHWFETTEEALTVVREWYVREMADDHSGDGWFNDEKGER